MAAPPLANTFEGGTDGVAISTGNSGGASGDAFNNIQGTLAKFAASAAMHGSLGMEIVDSAVTTQVRWQSFPALTVDVYVRFYLWISGTPTGGRCGCSNIVTSGGVNSGGIAVRRTTDSPAGVMVGMLASGNEAAGSVGSVAVPAAPWIRVEYRLKSSTTVGEIEWKWWSSPESTGAPSDTVNATGLVLGADSDRVAYGLQATNPNTPFTIRIDDVKVATAGWIGPSDVATIIARPTPRAVIVAG